MSRINVGNIVKFKIHNNVPHIVTGTVVTSNSRFIEVECPMISINNSPLDDRKTVVKMVIRIYHYNKPRDFENLELKQLSIGDRITYYYYNETVRYEGVIEQVVGTEKKGWEYTVRRIDNGTVSKVNNENVLELSTPSHINKFVFKKGFLKDFNNYRKAELLFNALASCVAITFVVYVVYWIGVSAHIKTTPNIITKVGEIRNVSIKERYGSDYQNLDIQFEDSDNNESYFTLIRQMSQPYYLNTLVELKYDAKTHWLMSMEPVSSIPKIDLE